LLSRRLINTFRAGVSLALIVMMASAALVSGPARVAAQGATSTAAAAAPETSVVFMALNMDTSSQQYQLAAELLVRAGFASSVEELISQIAESAAEEAGGDGDTLSDLEPFLGGELGIVVTDLGLPEAGALDELVGNLPVQTGVASDEPGIALIVDASDDAAAWAKVQELLQDEADDRGIQISEETYEGVTISYIPPDETVEDDSGMAIAQAGDFVFMSDRPESLHALIDVQNGTTGAVSATSGYQAVAAELPSEYLLFGYINGAAIAEAMAASDPTMGSLTLGPDQFVTDSGFAVLADTPGLRIESVAIPAPGASIPSYQAFEAQLPSIVPSDTLFLVDGNNLGASGVLDGLFLAIIQLASGGLSGEVATPEPGVSAEEFAAQQFEQFAQVIGFNIKTEFIDQLQGEYGLAVWGITADESGDVASDNIGVLFTSNVGDPQTLNNALMTISFLVQSALQGSGTLTTTTVGNDTIWVGTFGSEGSDQFSVEFGIVNGQFFISTNGAYSLLSTPSADSLADNPTYQAVMAELPSERFSTLYIDIRQLGELSAPASAALSGMGGPADASDRCAEFASQDEAQAAFDEDPATNWELDQDFDGQACEDYFDSTPEAEASPEIGAEQLEKIPAFALVGYQDGDTYKASGLLLIEE